MTDDDDNDLHACVMALKDVVLPAVDAGNPIAQQQLRYVIDFLSFQRSRRPLQAWLDRALLERHLATARAVAAHAPREAATALVDAIDAAERDAQSLGDTRARTMALATRLEDETAALVRASARMDGPTRDAIARAVVATSKALFDLQRAWCAPLSVELDASALPALDSVLDLPADLQARPAR